MAGRERSLIVKEMPHSERLPVILDTWKEMGVGDILRIINDHNPMPLQYLFQGEFGGQFEWSYEKEGPDEWVIAIKRVSTPGAKTTPTGKDKDREALKDVLRSLHQEGLKDDR